jgi:lipopolysaccharide assembly outer membrane protein LptD (OstA)
VFKVLYSATVSKIILVCLLITTFGYAANSRKLNSLKSFTLTPTQTDSAKKDTIIAPKPSKSFLDDKVTYNATDSMIIDMENEKAYLYNNAVVVYQDMKLEAGYIEIDFANNTVYSRGMKDSAGAIVQKPLINQASDQYKAGEITYNFDTKKGKIKDVITQQGGGYVHGSDIKKDSNNVCFVANGKYTTCNLDHPHFYIGAKKIKMIPDDKIITGPAQLNIADIPTPLVVPFGYFPNKKGRTSGILMPTVGESQQWGFFLKDGGFYWGNNEYVDVAIRGDAYTNGSFAIRTQTNYNRRYKFNGGLNLNYSQIINGYREFATTTRQNDFFVKWRHSQDTKAKPGSRFSADVNAGSSSYNKFNGNVTGDYLKNTFQSNISYSKNFDGTPFNMSLNGRHSQNTINKKTDISLPDFALNMNRIYPLKGQTKVGSFAHNEIEKFGLSASLNARNDISEYDTALYDDANIKRNIQNMKNGVKVSVPISTSMNLLKYLTLTPTLNTNTYMYFKTTQKEYNSVLKGVDTTTVDGMAIAADYSFSTRLATVVYGNYMFSTKRLKQIRHIITPAITGTYKPDFSESKWGYYKTIQSDSTGNTINYSKFENGIFGSPSSGTSKSVGFNLNNSLEAKMKIKTDSGSIDKKVMLIENLSIDASYNEAAPIFKWSEIRMAARTTLFKILSVNANTSLDPYQIDSVGKRIEQFEWKNNRIGRIKQSSIALGTGIKSKTKSKNTPSATDPTKQDELDFIYKNPDAYVDFNIPWSVNLSYVLNSFENYGSANKKMENTIAQTLTFNGDVNITKKWKINVRTGYDFNTKKLSFTNVDVYRDLHCWQMSFNWVPFGLRQSYSFTISVKSSMLQDLKLTRRRNWQDYQ